MQQTKTFRSDLGKARGLGSAKEGTGHWIGMKLSSLALIPLTIWFVVGAIGLLGLDHQGAIAVLKQPINVVMMLLYIGFGLYHSAHGLQVIIEDYIHTPWRKITMLSLNTLLHIVAGVTAIVCVILIALK